MIDIFVIVLILFGANRLLSFFIHNEKYKDWLHSKKVLSVLFLWSLLGLIAGLDQSNAFGCVISPMAMLTNKNIFLSGLSIGLIFMAYRTENIGRQVFLGIGEALFWIGKLFLFKGGYAVGFIGSADLSILLYDTLSIYIRLFALSLAVNHLGVSVWKISALVLIIMAVKASFFARPAMMVYEDRVLEAKAQIAQNQMFGDWKGFIEEGGEHKGRTRNEVEVSIDSNHIHFNWIAQKLEDC